MDISLVITRTGIFIAVYSIVLGFPFAIAFGWQDQLTQMFGAVWWMVPLVVSTVLATGGPFIYLFIQNRAEVRLFEEQTRYQTTLRQASIGMGRIKDLNRLLNLIVYIVTRTVRLEHSMIYLDDHAKKGFLLRASRSRPARSRPPNMVAYDSMLIKYLNETRSPVVYEEIKQRAQDYGDLKLARLEKELKDLDAALAVPVFLGKKMIAILSLGEKRSKELFSNGDISALQILAGQAALGIENSMYYENVKTANQQLFQAEKLAYVGTLAGSIVHEIRNPLTSIKTYLSCLPHKYHEPEFRAKFERLIPKEIQRVEGIVSQLLSLVRRRPSKSFPVDIVRLIQSSLELLENSFQLKNIHIETDYEEMNLAILGDEEHLRQALMNLFLNAIQAMEEGGTLSVSARRIGDGNAGPRLLIAVKDTGHGIPETQLRDLFKIFQTTKEEGIGLGLSITREIIEDHGGNICVKSKVGEGTTFFIELPVGTAKSQEG